MYNASGTRTDKKKTTKKLFFTPLLCSNIYDFLLHINIHNFHSFFVLLLNLSCFQYLIQIQQGALNQGKKKHNPPQCAT